MRDKTAIRKMPKLRGALDISSKEYRYKQRLEKWQLTLINQIENRLEEIDEALQTAKGSVRVGYNWERKALSDLLG